MYMCVYVKSFGGTNKITIEPSGDWTVEEAFQWTLLRSMQSTQLKYQELEQSIRQQVEQAIHTILEKQVGGGGNDDDDNNKKYHVSFQLSNSNNDKMDVVTTTNNDPTFDEDNVENYNPHNNNKNNKKNKYPQKQPQAQEVIVINDGNDDNGKTGKGKVPNTWGLPAPQSILSKPSALKKHQSRAHTTTTTTTSARTTTTNSFALHVDVVEGEHTGKTFDINISMDKEAWIGRSRGKKFKDGKGISLYKDLEVSTTHGKFMVTGNGQVCFVDTGSSNGTRVLVQPNNHNNHNNNNNMNNGDEIDYKLEADVSFPLITGTQLLCGQSRLQITVNPIVVEKT